MTNSILSITDCLSTVNLLNIKDGFITCEWIPSVAPLKGGGVWQSSPLVDGKRLSLKNYDNAVETFTLNISGINQDAVISYLQELTTMLEKAVSYWTTSWQKQPVWIEARGATETNSRFAVIKGYKIDNLANPFSQPFFGDCKSVMNELTLVIERDHWIDQIPGTALALSLNTLQNADRENSIPITSTASNPADDVAVSIGEGASGSDINALNTYLGVISTAVYECGVRFPGVAIPQGATILNAYITVTESALASDDTYDLPITILGELTPNAQVFDNDSSHYFTRKANSTAVKSDLVLPADGWTTGATQTFTGLAGIVQEIVNQNAWVSGNALAVFIFPNIGGFDMSHDSYRIFGTVDSGLAPVLHVSYITYVSEPIGHEDTSSNSLYVANRHCKYQLTHIFYNDTGTGFSGNLVGTALPWTLLPAVPANGDEIYFGISTDVDNAAPVDNLVFDISVPSAGFTLTWYHSYTGGIFHLCTYEIYSDKSLNLSESGESTVIFAKSNYYVTATVNGVTGYWLKAVVGGATGATTPPQQETREIYTCVTPFVDIDGSDIKGEISALARIRVEGTALSDANIQNIIVGSRSKSRGEDFSSYINISDNNNNTGISVNPGLSCSIVDDSVSPSGRALEYVTPGSLSGYATVGTISLDGTISGQYQGSFRAFLRHRIIGSAFGHNFMLRIGTSPNIHGDSWVYSQWKYTEINDAQGSSNIVDCGVINLGTGSTSYADNMGNINFVIQLQWLLQPTARTIHFYDIILIPTDEWFGWLNCTAGGSRLVLGTVLDIDSIGNPRTTRAILRNLNSGELLNEEYRDEWMKSTRGGPFLQINSDQRLWFFNYGGIVYSEYTSTFPASNTKVGIYIANRYLTMRGSA